MTWAVSPPPGSDVGLTKFTRNADNTLIAARDETYLHPGMATALALFLIAPYEERTYELVVVVHCAQIQRTTARLYLTTQIAR